MSKYVVMPTTENPALKGNKFMKPVLFVVIGAIAVSMLSGCSVNRGASDLEVCKALSGDTFYSASDANQVIQERVNAGTMTISPAQCYQIAQQTSAQWAATSANLNQMAIQQQAIEASRQPQQVNVTVNKGYGW